MKHNVPALFLCLLTMLCACGTASEPADNSASADTAPVTAPPPAYVLPDLDYADAAFSMLSAAVYSESLVKEATGEVLNDAKFNMERRVEDALHVDISENTMPLDQIGKAVTQLVMSGDQTYDAVAMMDRYALQLAMTNSILPLQSIETLHLKEPYWGGKLSDTLTIGESQFFGVGSCNLATYDRVACLLLNKTLAAAHDLEIPYDDVFAGTWTYDDLFALRGLALKDVNGDGVMDMSDSYTFGTSDSRLVAHQIYISMGTSFVEKDADNYPVITAYDNERMVDVFQKIENLLFSGENDILQFLDYTSFTQQDGFSAGRILFYFAKFMNLQDCREMKDDFAILPLPKYNEQQEDYRCRTFDSTFFMIPVTQDDPVFSGAVLDALSCVGHYDMLPVYTDTVLQDKIARDEQSKRCLQICFDTRTIDMGEAFLYDIFGGAGIYKNIVSKGAEQFSSYLERNRKKADKALADIVEMFQSLE